MKNVALNVHCTDSQACILDIRHRILNSSQNSCNKATKYCKTLYFNRILIWRFCSVEISLHFNLVFCQGVFCKVKFNVTSHMN